MSCVLLSIAPTKKSRHIIAKIHVGRTTIEAEAEQSVYYGSRELEQRSESSKTLNVRAWRYIGFLIEYREVKKEKKERKKRQTRKRDVKTVVNVSIRYEME